MPKKRKKMSELNHIVSIFFKHVQDSLFVQETPLSESSFNSPFN